MGIRSFDGRHIVTHFRRGIHMSFSCTNLEKAQAKLKEMCEETVVELTHKRYYFQPDRILELHLPKYVK